MHFEDAPERVFGSRAKIKVLRSLHEMKESELTGREIARRCRLTPARTHAVLKELAGEGLVNMRVLGRNHMYSFNPDSVLMGGVRAIFDYANSGQSYLRRVASEELSDKRVLSAILYADRQQVQGRSPGTDRMLVVTDSEVSTAGLSKRVETLRERLRRGLGASPEIRVQSIEQFRSAFQAGDEASKSAVETQLLLLGEPPASLASEKRHAQRFRFPLFHRS